MVRSKFLATISAEEYTELRAMALIERVGLERDDLYATAICRAMGADIEEDVFRHQETQIKTLDQEFGALSGFIQKKK